MVHLLSSSPIAVPQFCSLSIYLPPTNDAGTIHMPDPLILPGPTATIHRQAAVDAVFDVHQHVRLLDADTSNVPELHVHKVTKNGLMVYYRLLNAAQTAKLSPLLLASPAQPPPPPGTTPAGSTTTATAPTNNNNNTTGNTSPSPYMDKASIVLAVGVSGVASLYGVSQSVYDLKQRLHDAVQFFLLLDITRDSFDKIADFLLSDTEALMSNEQVAAARSTLTWDAAVATTTSRNLPQHAANMLLSPITDNFGFGRRSSTTAGNAIAGGNHNTAGGAGGADANTVRLELPADNSAASSQRIINQLTILSFSDNETALRAYGVPAAERRPQLSRTAAQRRRKQQPNHDYDLDGAFDYKGLAKKNSNTASSSLTSPGLSKQPQQQQYLQQQQSPNALQTQQQTVASQPKKLVLASSKKDTARAVRTSATSSSTRGGNNNNDDTSTVRSGTSQTPSSSAVLLVNLALNEDLTCAYRNTQLASCVVEGVVQVRSSYLLPCCCAVVVSCHLLTCIVVRHHVLLRCTTDPTALL
jgi:hypothetical protein